MNRSSRTPINDELLSAYIDGLVTNEEKAEVEAAVAADPALAWELDTLRRTVALVRDLPQIPLPRSFVLTEEQVADVLTERRLRSNISVAAQSPAPFHAPTPARQRGFSANLFVFFNSGNLLLRNAAAVAALFLVIVLVTSPATGTQSPQMASLSPESSTSAFQAETAPPPANAEKAAPAAAGEASAENILEVAPSPTEATEPSLAQMKAAPAPLEQAAPARLIAPEMGAMPAASGVESGPMTMQDAPAEMVPFGPSARSFPGAGDGIAEENAAPGDVGLFSSDAPVESSQSVVASEDVTETSAVIVQEDVVVAESESEEVAVLEDSAVVELSALPAASEPVAALAESLPQEQPAQDGWSIWQIVQAALGGLTLLLILLWLGSRRRVDFS